MPEKSSSAFQENHEEYRIFTAGVHTKPPPVLGVPALILHYGLWQPDGDAVQWHGAIDMFLYVLYRGLMLNPSFDKAKVVSPNYDKDDTLYLFHNYVLNSSEQKTDPSTPLDQQKRDLLGALIEISPKATIRYNVFSVRTTFHGLPLLVRVELYSEFLSIDFICDFDRSDGLSDYITDIAYIYEVIEARFSSNFAKEFEEIKNRLLRSA